MVPRRRLFGVLFFLATYPQRVGMNAEQCGGAVVSAYASAGMAQSVVDVAFREFPERGPRRGAEQIAQGDRAVPCLICRGDDRS